MNIHEAQYFEGTALDPEHHAVFVKRIDEFAATAHIPVQYILDPMTKHCTAEDIDWMKTYRKHTREGKYGLCYFGKQTRPVLPRMMSITGAALRNFIDARVLPVQQLLELARQNDVPEPQLLLIPNFYIDGSQPIAGTGQVLSSLLIDRMATSQQTVIYVESLTKMEDAYGTWITAHITDNFDLIEA